MNKPNLTMLAWTIARVPLSHQTSGINMSTEIYKNNKQVGPRTACKLIHQPEGYLHNTDNQVVTTPNEDI